MLKFQVNDEVIAVTVAFKVTLQAVCVVVDCSEASDGLFSGSFEASSVGTDACASFGTGVAVGTEVTVAFS